jgi:hypothetical protein
MLTILVSNSNVYLHVKVQWLVYINSYNEPDDGPSRPKHVVVQDKCMTIMMCKSDKCKIHKF